MIVQAWNIEIWTVNTDVLRLLVQEPFQIFVHEYYWPLLLMSIWAREMDYTSGMQGSKTKEGSKAPCNTSGVGQNSNVTDMMGDRLQLHNSRLSGTCHFTTQPALLFPCVQHPVGMPQPRWQHSVGKLVKIILKAVCKGTRNFTLCNLDTTKACSCDDLTKVIRRQLHQDISFQDISEVSNTHQNIWHWLHSRI